MKAILSIKITTAQAFVIIAAVFGLFFVFNTPPLWGADETSHIARIYQIAEGHILAQHLGETREQGGYGGRIPESLYALILNVDRDLSDGSTHDSSLGTHNIDNPALYSELGKGYLSDSTSVEYAFPNAAAYSPVAYAPGLVGMMVAKVSHADITWTITLIRLSDLLFFTLCVYLALKILANFRIKWLLFIVALLPMTLFEASIITADVTTNALVVLFSALIIKALMDKENRLSKAQLILLAISTIAIPLLKPTYAILLLALLFVPNRQFRTRKIAFIFKITTLTLAFVLMTIWSYLVSGAIKDEALIQPGNNWQLVNPSLQESFMLHHPFTYAKIIFRTFLLQDNKYFVDMLGNLGFNQVLIPGMGIISELTALALALALVGKTAMNKLQGGVILSICIGCVLVIVTGMYITYTSVAAPILGGIQGRYFIPLLPLGIFGLMPFFSHRLSINTKSTTYRSTVKAICLLVIVCLTITSIKYYYVTWG